MQGSGGIESEIAPRVWPAAITAVREAYTSRRWDSSGTSPVKDNASHMSRRTYCG